MIYNNNIGTSKVFYSGFTIKRIFACGGELVWSESPFTFKAQYTLNDATSGEVACNGSSTLSIIDYDDYETLINIRYMTVGECVDTWVVPSTPSYRSLRTLDLSHSNITTLPENFMKGETSLRNVYLNNSTTTISQDAFSGCTSLSAITIPSSVTSIDSEAFRNSGLRDITIHSGITYGGYVYSRCSGATAVTIEQGTLRIEKGTFASCTSLSSVTFPSSITFVGTQAFIGCTGLQSLTFTSTTPPNLGNEDSLSSNNCPIYVPCSAMAAYLAHEDWQPYVDRLRPIESQCGSIQYRWQPSGTTCIDFDKWQNNIKQVTYNSGTTWMNVSPAEYSASTLIEHNSEDCGYIPPQYRTITSTTCVNVDKWQQNEYQVSYDEGQTWTTTGTSATTLLEANSYDCGYRTRTTSSATYCDGVDKYVDVYSQVSTDAGQTWTTTATTKTLVEANSYDCGYRTRQTSGSAYCNGYDKYVDVYSQVSRDSGTTWTTTATTPTLVEAQSEDCGYVPPIEPQYRTITSTTCVNVDKWQQNEYQVSYDEGQTWTTTGTSATTLLEANSYDCGYRTRTTSSATYCDGVDKYIDVYDQVSEDYGESWTTTATTATLVEADSEDCGYVPPVSNNKFEATYNDGTTYTAACDSDSTLGTGTTRNGGYAKYSGMTSAVVGNCVTSIGKNAFYNFTSLTSVTIPDSVTSIGDNAFKFCSGLTSVNIPDSVTSIGDYAFQFCTGLTSVNIPSGITSIGNSTFYSCEGLTGITIPNSVTSIGDYAFHDCRSLTSIDIPDSVTSIGEDAFQSCTGLISLIVNATTPPQLGSNALAYTNDSPIYVPASSVNAYKAASGWSTYASRIQAIP